MLNEVKYHNKVTIEQAWFVNKESGWQSLEGFFIALRFIQNDKFMELLKQSSKAFFRKILKKFEPL